jgi:competence protein ComEA
VKDFFNSLFGASSKEIKGLSLLILVLILFLLVPRVINYFSTSDNSYLATDARILDSLVAVLEVNQNIKSSLEDSPNSTFEFNPNNASIDDFLRLGFGEKVSNRIINYRSKGGVFKVKADLLKIYGIDSGLVIKLKPSINLPTTVANKSSPRLARGEEDLRTKPVPVKPEPKELPDFDINLSDTSMLQTIKGIGSVLSRRIIEFRDNLGGIVDVNQLYEVYNLDSTVVSKLIDKAYIDSSFMPSPLQINSITEAQLASHPYISWKRARLIIAYRNQHGNFTSSEDLLKVYSVDEELIEKIDPYLDWTPSN